MTEGGQQMPAKLQGQSFWMTENHTFLSQGETINTGSPFSDTLEASVHFINYHPLIQTRITSRPALNIHDIQKECWKMTPKSGIGPITPLNPER